MTEILEAPPDWEGDDSEVRDPGDTPTVKKADLEDTPELDDEDVGDDGAVV